MKRIAKKWTAWIVCTVMLITTLVSSVIAASYTITVRAELDAMLAALESHYGLKPILYATEESYECYLAGAYEEYDIWIRNVIAKPRMSDNRAWTFWQYTNRGRLDGYAGEEQFIDINVFRGTDEEFSRYPRYTP